ncbi:transcriptional regulator [Lentilactobacillus curieae]|uniref:Transcriptional regulator n=1 Tax=Lentilactobacillus curieae TaxID=1138822 RepID=A0A1S6QIA5_9LACO|nr:helix-turn-helix domain-containing protein [Lentilactobacillus curieae]AQW21343.1 transcriptional regulator [Lentilactobacillus curieae]
MSVKRVSEFAKLMSDEKIVLILKVTNVSEGVTAKKISEKAGVPVSQLYYKIKKLVDAGLLEIVNVKSVKNLQEYYYSSAGFRDANQEFDGNEMDVSAAWVADHSDEVAQWLLYTNQRFLDSLQYDTKMYGKATDYKQQIHSSYLTDTAQLSKEAEDKLFNDVRKLLQDAEKNDKGKDKQTINFIFEKWMER